MLVSARNTWALYEVNEQTGQVVAEAGGKHSTIKMGSGTLTAFQHDATLLPNGLISVFDNGGVPVVHPQSRGILVALNQKTGTETLVSEFEHPGTALKAGSQGNVQLLASGNLFIGWGAEPWFSEFSPSGQLLYDAHMPPGDESYRTYRFPWTGTPQRRAGDRRERGKIEHHPGDGVRELERGDRDRLLAGARGPLRQAARGRGQRCAQRLRDGDRHARSRGVRAGAGAERLGCGAGHLARRSNRRRASRWRASARLERSRGGLGRWRARPGWGPPPSWRRWRERSKPAGAARGWWRGASRWRASGARRSRTSTTRRTPWRALAIPPRGC